MKKLLNFLTVFLMAVSISHAQEHEMHCMIYKLPEQYLIQNSSLIVRAEVLSKVSEWDASKTNIFSYYRLKVYEDFTGNAPTFITLVSEGGQVGNDEMQFGDRIDLTVGEEVISCPYFEPNRTQSYCCTTQSTHYQQSTCGRRCRYSEWRESNDRYSRN